MALGTEQLLLLCVKRSRLAYFCPQYFSSNKFTKNRGEKLKNAKTELSSTPCATVVTVPFLFPVVISVRWFQESSVTWLHEVSKSLDEDGREVTPQKADDLC